VGGCLLNWGTIEACTMQQHSMQSVHYVCSNSNPTHAHYSTSGVTKTVQWFCMSASIIMSSTNTQQLIELSTYICGEYTS